MVERCLSSQKEGFRGFKGWVELGWVGMKKVWCAAFKARFRRYHAGYEL